MVLFALLFIKVSGQKADIYFDKQWKEVDSLLTKKNLTRTALEKVNIIYKQAVLQKAVGHQIKALIYRYNLEESISEKDEFKTIRDLESEINRTSDKTARSILYSLLANKYQQYFNAHRWQYYNRSKTEVSFIKEDLTTWNADDFHTAISKNYKESLEPKELLQKTSLAPYNPIIIKGKDVALRPTLYDLLAHEALDYFKTGETYITKPTYVFALNDANAFSVTETFVKHSFKSKDSTSNLLSALQIFQHLESFHFNDKDKNALTDVNIERLQWVYNTSTVQDKDKLYKQALENIISTSTASRTAQAYYLLAEIERSKASQYIPYTDTTNRYANVKALEIIEDGLKKFGADKDPAVANMQNLRLQIFRKNIESTLETVNIPDRPFRSLIKYTNVPILYTRIIKVTTDKQSDLFDNNWSKLIAQKPYRSFSYNLPQTQDYQQHATEIKIDALPVGEYILLCSSDKDFNDSTGITCKNSFYVSNISYVKRGQDYFVLNRETGKPLKNVTVKITKTDWSSGKRAEKAFATKQTNEKGYFTFEADKTGNEYGLYFNTDNDSLHVRQNTYLYNNINTSGNTVNLTTSDFEKTNATVFFFTDRGIYRPGQKVFFKGLATTKDQATKKAKLYIPEKQVIVYLKDVNNKTVDSLSLSVNDYGSFTGSFNVPQNVLTGMFSLSVKDYNTNYTAFSVEEYKRPQFYVEFDKIKKSYKLNDSITITGTAKAYNGTAVSGSNVKFNVQRNTRYIFYGSMYRGFRGYPSHGSNLQIANGEIQTDANGKFTFTFKALPDDKQDPAHNPLFDFNVNVDVTDISGETRSADTRITVSYKSLQLTVNSPAFIYADSLKNLTVTTTNLSDEKVGANVTVAIYELQTPQRAIRERLWQRPDEFLLTQQEYIGSFPNDNYDNDLEPSDWKKIGNTVEKKINTATDTKFDLSLKAGYYKVEATAKDSAGNEVKDIKYMQVYNKTTLPGNDYNFTGNVSKQAQPGETAQFIKGTAADKIYIIRVIDKGSDDDKKDNYQLVEQNKGIQPIDYTVTEQDRGGVAIADVFVYNNRAYTSNYNVIVPWSNKQLNVTYKTYRDKTEPGSKEQWSINVAGINGEKKSAELLTAMYDASLDQFSPYSFNEPNIYRVLSGTKFWDADLQFNVANSQIDYRYNTQWHPVESIQYPRLAFTLGALEEHVYYSTTGRMVGKNAMMVVPSPAAAAGSVDRRSGYADFKTMSDTVTEQVAVTDKEAEQQQNNNVQIRNNFNETAFFFPQLYADSLGNYSFSFTMPDAVTQWKWMSFAHTKDLSFGTNQALITTQKTLMVQAGVPRFLREGDNIELSAKLSNLSDKELTGQVTLELIDAITGTSVDGWFQNVFPVQYFTVAAGQTSAIKFPVSIPFSYNKPLTYRLVAKADNYSDGEENTIPVVTNRMLVTESLPLQIKGDGTQQFKFEKLLNNTSETLTNQALTVEYTPNPAWYAVQALPYLMEYPYDCVEQTFNKFYANALASYIVNKHPRIKAIFEKWSKDSSALKSNLEKNQELKQVLLEETPWVLNAENEAQQKKNIGLLFDVVAMSKNITASIEKLQQMQAASGAFSWFKGGYPDRYMTNYIVTGIGKLKALGALTPQIAGKLDGLSNKAIAFLDSKLTEDYQSLKKNKADLTKQQISGTQIQYLYMRSMFADKKFADKTAYTFYYQQAKQYWVKQSLYDQALLGLTFLNNNEKTLTVNNIIPSIAQNAIINNQGMYWKNMHTNTYWHESPVEYVSLMINLFNQVNKTNNDAKLSKNINDMQTWLLLNKQTNNWKTTIATADACYALLSSGNDLSDNSKQVSIKLGSLQITPSQEEAGTGYFKQVVEGRLVKPEMGNITVTTTQAGQPGNQSTLSYGAVYWQYFEDINNITKSSGPLSLTKKLFIQKNTDAGKTLQPVNDNDELKIGDKVIVRLVLKTDRDMEYLHLKDMRAASMEPVNVLSSYKYQDGLGYYESTKDVSSSFFIGNLRKGTYVFEYPVFITHTGTFSAGIATIQCMYAPEFTSHSEGLKIRVAK